MTFPQELEAERDILESTRCPYLGGSAVTAAATRWNSKLGGLPYWPQEQPLPRDRDGEALALLIQINFAELPPLEGFPRGGILQLFLAHERSPNHLAGLRHGVHALPPTALLSALTAPEYFAVVYHPVLRPTHRLSGDEMAWPRSSRPLHGSARLDFVADSHLILPGDYRFERLTGRDPDDFFDRFDPAVEERYWEWNQHDYLVRLGGYTETVLGDPREECDADEEWQLLLCIEESTEADPVTLNWGDGGLCNLFISKADLKARDFSRVAYYWDSANVDQAR